MPMALPAIVRHPRLLLSPVLWGPFPAWYFMQKPLSIAVFYAGYASAVAEIFSLMFLLRTLFAPWKSIVEEYPTRLDLAKMFAAITLNITSRVIGAVIRIVAIVVGVVMQVLLLACVCCLLALWFSLPVLLIMFLLTLLGIL